MSAPAYPNIDHLAHFVPDIDRAGAALIQLGYTLTPFSAQSHRLAADGPVVPAGTANRCVMMQHGYLEILTPTHDTPNAAQLRNSTGVGEGIPAMTRILLFLLLIWSPQVTWAQSPRVVDVASRAGVTQRFLLLQPETAKATVILFAGGDGGILIASDGSIKRSGNFLVRSRELFAAQGLAVAVIDAPSDRQSFPYLNNFRQTAEHVADVKAAIAWLRQELKIPVWLVGTSRGTQSAAYVATQLSPADGGPDGIVLTSSMLADNRGRPVPDMALDNIKVPVLVAHHMQDGCRYCLYADVPKLTSKLGKVPRTALLTFDGGNNVGDPCEARAYHGYNGIEADVVTKLAAWITAN